MLKKMCPAAGVGGFPFSQRLRHHLPCESCFHFGDSPPETFRHTREHVVVRALLGSFGTGIKLPSASFPPLNKSITSRPIQRRQRLTHDSGSFPPWMDSAFGQETETIASVSGFIAACSIS